MSVGRESECEPAVVGGHVVSAIESREEQSQLPSMSLLDESTVACNFCRNASALTQTGAVWLPRWATARHTRSGNTAPASA